MRPDSSRPARRPRAPFDQGSAQTRVRLPEFDATNAPVSEEHARKETVGGHVQAIGARARDDRGDASAGETERRRVAA